MVLVDGAADSIRGRSTIRVRRTGGTSGISPSGVVLVAAGVNSPGRHLE
ncbi:MAG TPA: hypothetical protein VED84_08440 [Acidimicrobiales bacterium]|nr:hypothetical protein [Acidimicrobiales bacterium]